MAGFKGSIKYNMDSAGRVALPQNYRKELGEIVTLIQGAPNAIFIIPESGFDEWVESNKFFGDEGYQMGNPEHEEIMDRIYGSSVDVKVDTASRISIPEDLRVAAGLTNKSVTFVGKRSYFELWDSEKRDEYMKNVPSLLDVVSRTRK